MMIRIRLNPIVANPIQYIAVAVWAGILRFIAPGYGYCGCCGKPWKFTAWHSTEFTDGRGLFPLCKSCWGKMTPEQRLPYYRDLWEEWGADEEHAKWKDIETAVLAGK